ncbi:MULTISPECIES: YicC/YloC family endoribonuclease [Pontibacillus]|uniref:YicC/YloC family endoribonuclease n=1 Tax=Pontibacillus chungwhensis TaxID=265426 RepID=A0ABY8V357_9BACI|nr:MULTISPECIES: YicC/YloC family endoribonuclease [Pontibacillus]MCD5322626.1 YicC family protein [Pontibacillus sp. HN14]WIF99908.1 YicC/YloC family endoribonuclease [Pontibacillus chungwhensis]
MVRSMTGYGRSSRTIQETSITVEIKTVNHRFLDITPKMPRSLLYLEEKIKKALQHPFIRGRVELFITIEGNALTKRQVKTDWELLDQYIQQLKEAKERYGLQEEISVNVLTKLEDLFTIQELEEHEDRMESVILSCVNEAAEKVVSMRVREGEALQEDLKDRLNKVATIVEDLRSRRPLVVQETQERIKSRIEEYAQQALPLEESRLLHEVGLLAEKGDIAEEITRLYSHTDQFVTTLDVDDSIGRKLDFIVQEMNRETNTIGSKSTDSKISEWVVLLKSEIEKIKEQVQNVE